MQNVNVTPTVSEVEISITITDATRQVTEATQQTQHAFTSHLCVDLHTEFTIEESVENNCDNLCPQVHNVATSTVETRPS